MPSLSRVDDVLQYLRAALDLPLDGSPIYEIGGPDRVSYGALMDEYAHQRGLRRLMIHVPVLSPGLSSLWLGLVTPIYARIGRKLIDSIRIPTVVQDDTPLRNLCHSARGLREAIALLSAQRRSGVRPDSLVGRAFVCGLLPHWGGVRFGNRLIDSQAVSMCGSAPPKHLPRSSASAARPAGTMATGFGVFAVGSTCLLAA